MYSLLGTLRRARSCEKPRETSVSREIPQDHVVRDTDNESGKGCETTGWV